ncbi:MAG: hypothetical protein WCZ18_08495 [Ottowia sp.]|nr:hypothetical protein [Ottowia sp.]
MLYIDLPTRSEFTTLFDVRADACVSIYLKTTPVTREIQAARIELGNRLREAQSQLQAGGLDKRRLAALSEQIDDLIADDEFWRLQANSLAVFATPDSLRTYRLANELTTMVQVADRFHLKPLLRAVTFPHAAFILALSENAVRLLEMHADLPPAVVKVPGMPTDGASALGRSTLNERGLHRRMEGSEGQNVRLRQFARLVDAALRPVLAGRETPLILAATGRVAPLFAELNSYPHLLPETIADSPDRATEAELAQRARPILDRHYAQQLQAIHALHDKRTGEHRTTSDLSDAARAATFGAIDTLLADIDSMVPGFVDEQTGAITLVQKDDAKAYDIVDEIVGRAFGSGARVLGVRRQDIPGHRDLAAILRHPV